MTIAVSYLVCTMPRSGSEWLCRRLTERGLGAPGEHLRNTVEGGYDLTKLQALWPAYARNGIYAAKASLELRFLGLHAVLPPGPRGFVYLTRDDVNEQARSLAIAQRYGGWDRHGNRSLPVSAQELATARDHIVGGYRFWVEWFEQHGVTPLHVTFEQSLADADEVTDRIVTYINGLGRS